jgi:RNA polymerase sigma factor (sigma-70 family)
MSSTSTAVRPDEGAWFVTTHWSVVLSAGRSDTPRARHALERLCETYWYPLYAYVRRRGYSPEDAQDLTQEFFARLLKSDRVRTADQQKGRFRSFLLAGMNNFLADEWDKSRAQKRGGGMQTVPLQFATAESRYGSEPIDRAAPEQTFERRWALTLLEDVLKRLGEEHEREGKAVLFAALNPCLVGDRTSLPYVELAQRMRMTESGIKSAVHRMRRRYRQLLREEIANTVASRAEVDDELRFLFTVLARG